MSLILKEVKDINEFRQIYGQSEDAKHNIFHRDIDRIPGRHLIYKMIKLNDGEETVLGLAALYQRDDVNKNIKFNGCLQDKKDFNYLKEAGLRLLETAFEQMGMEKVYIEYLERDVWKEDLANNIRLVHEAYLRNHVILNDKIYTLSVKAMLRHEYERIANKIKERDFDENK